MNTNPRLIYKEDNIHSSVYVFGNNAASRVSGINSGVLHYIPQEIEDILISHGFTIKKKLDERQHNKQMLKIFRYLGLPKKVKFKDITAIESIGVDPLTAYAITYTDKQGVSNRKYLDLPIEMPFSYRSKEQ